MSWSSKSHSTLLLLCNFLLNSQFTLCRFRIIYSSFFSLLQTQKRDVKILQPRNVAFLHQAEPPSETLPTRVRNVWSTPGFLPRRASDDVGICDSALHELFV